MGDSEWSRLAGLKLAQENLQSRVKEEDSITNVKNVTVSDTLLKHDLCELVIAEVCTAINDDGAGVPNQAKRDFKNLQTTRASLVGSTFALTHFDNVVRAMMSPGGSIVASLENVNGFLAVNIPPDDLINTDFEQKGVVPKVTLHILEEFVLLLGRHSLTNKIPHMVVCKVGKPWGKMIGGKILISFCINYFEFELLKEENPLEQSCLGIFLSKEIFEGGVIRIHNAFVHDEDYTYGKVACITHKLKG
nr:hypothetical protein [Tanacetum cinerariifolium]